MCSGLALMLARWFGEPPILNIAPRCHPPRKARRSTSWLWSALGAMDGDGSTEWRARRWLTFELSGRHRYGAAKRIIDSESFAAPCRWRSARAKG
jgi:hypothetical protein